MPVAIPPGTKLTVMESKIVIDIQHNGQPYIYVDFKPTDDLRDKVLSRFLFESGAMNLKSDGNPPNPTPLTLHVLWFDQQTGRVQAMIEHPAPEKDIPGSEPDLLKQLDDMCVESLPPDAYEKWSDVMWRLKANRQALKKTDLPR